MKRVALAVEYPPDLRHPLQASLREADALSRAALLLWGPTEAVTTLIWFDGDEVAVERALEAVESATRTHLVSGDGGTYAFVHQTDYEFAAPILDLLGESHVVFPPPVTFREDGRVEFDAVGESTALSEFHAALSDLGSVAIRRVEPYRRGESGETMTDRQREALAAAVAVGYYEVPRTGSLDDVAARLDCARSTAGELLRKAEAALATAAVTST
jgi:hypothetical protein